MAVQTNGRERALWLATNASMRRTRSSVLANEPRRISRPVMIAEPALDLVQPGAVGRREVNVAAGPRSQPRAAPWVLLACA